MPRVDATELTAEMEKALAGETGSLRSFLRGHSNLPGPRGNLELAWQTADLVAARAVGAQAARVWRVVSELASVGPEEAPADDPGEFLAFCGTVAAAAFAGAGRRRDEAWAIIRRAAEDPRWRLREAAAQAVQRAAALDRAGALAVLEGWAITGGWLLFRAVVAAVADPPLLADAAFVAAARHLHEVVLTRFQAADDRRDPAFRVLRQGLGYTLSVVVAAEPAPGFALLRALAAVPDPDLAWVLRSNLGKGRLARPYPAETKAVLRLLER